MSKEIRYYRHSETKWNKEGRLQGWLDSELTEHGIKLAREVQWQPDIVFSSDLNRAITTAKWMFPNQQLITTALLREIHLGDWQGKMLDELQQDPNYQCYQNAPHLFQVQSQESFQMVTKRMRFFHDQLEQFPFERIAVVSHGVALACLQCKLNQDSINNLWDYMLPSATYVVYEMKTL